MSSAKLILEPTTHAILAASASHRWMECPGSVRLTATIRRVANGASREGCAAHAVAQTCGPERIPTSSMAGREIVVDGETIVVDDEMVDAVQGYLDRTHDLASELPGSAVSFEEHFDLSWLHEGIAGTADAAIRQDFGVLRVRDLKYGYSWVDARGNPQLMTYGLGALGPDGGGYDRVILDIDQPRVGEPRSVEMDPADLLAWGHDVLRPAAARTREPDAALKEGEHCKYCPAASCCPKLRNSVSELVAVPDPALGGGFRLPALADLTPAQKGKVLVFAEAIGGFVKAVKEDVKAGLREGRYQADAVGFKFVQSKARRGWADEQAAIALANEAGIAAYTPGKLVSPAAMEKALKAAGLDPKAIAPLVAKTHGVSMAPVGDKRPAITVDAQSAFDGLDSE